MTQEGYELPHWAQRTIARAAKLSVQSGEATTHLTQPEPTDSAHPTPHRRIAVSRRVPSGSAITLEQRLVTLFMD